MDFDTYSVYNHRRSGPVFSNSEYISHYMDPFMIAGLFYEHLSVSIYLTRQMRVYWFIRVFIEYLLEN